MTSSILPTVARGWVNKITAAWNKSRDGMIELRRLLINAKARLAHGEFIPMVKRKLPFNRQTAHKLMTIASGTRISAHRVRYKRDDVIRWLRMTVHHSTAEYARARA